VRDCTSHDFLVIWLPQPVLFIRAVEEAHLDEAAGCAGRMTTGTENTQPLLLDPAIVESRGGADARLYSFGQPTRGCRMIGVIPGFRALGVVLIRRVEVDGHESVGVHATRDMGPRGQPEIDVGRARQACRMAGGHERCMGALPNDQS
jgi:hypothetical protein